MTGASGVEPVTEARLGPWVWIALGARLVLAGVWAWAGWAKVADADAAVGGGGGVDRLPAGGG